MATVMSLVFASCKQPSSDSGTENVTVTVKKDAHVTKAPDSFTLAKGSKLGFKALKDKMELEFTPTWLLAKITLNDASGTEITNTNPYTFNADTTIYISSRKEGTGEKLELTELKVAGKSVTIQDVMEAGKTREAKVLIEAKAKPGDAEIVYEPELVNSYWVLDVGKKSLKIKVKNGSDSKTYTLNIERTASDVVLLKKLTIGESSKEGAEITEEMVFTVPQNTTEVEVKAETDPADATVVFSPALVNEKLQLSGNETSLTITVGTAPKVSTYTVNVKKLAAGGDFVDTLFIYGGMKQGVSADVEKEQIDKVLNGEDVVLEVAGPKATILAASKVKTWKTFKINGVAFESFPYSTYTSVSLAELKLPAKGETMDLKIEVADENDVAQLNFKIKRTDETVDVPVTKLIIRDKNVLTTQTRVALHTGKPEFDGAEPSRIGIESDENALKSVTINSTPFTTVVEKTDPNNNPFWSIEGTVEGVSPSGKDVILVVEPTDTEAYHSITWNLHLKYKAAGKMRVDYEINGKNAYKLPLEFIQGIKTGTNPLIELEAKFLNIKLTCAGKIANVKINEETIQGDKLAAVGTSYVLTHSVPIDATEKQIDIEVTPADLGVYSTVVYKFKAKGDGTVEKISPTFEEISGDKNLPKATFLDKLEGTDKPLYKTAKETADIVIDMKGYDYDFLCKEVKINGEKTEVKIFKGFYSNFYKIKKSIPVDVSTPTDVKIEFIAKESLSENLTWQFQVQGGGEKPSLPKSLVSIFKINGVGGYSNPLPKELTDHLTDGTKPVHKFDGKKALVEVGSYNDTLIEKVVFKLDGEQKHEMEPVENNFAHTAKYEFEISDTNAHDVELIIKPKDKKYADLVYTFKLEWSGKKAPLPVLFGVNGAVQKDGYKATLPAETANLLVQTKADVMLEVKIGEDGNEETCQIITFTATDNSTVWQAQKNVSLVDSNGDAVEKTFAIKVKPKDATTYEETVCKYTLKGTKIAEDNAEFVWTTGQYAAPKVLSNVEWMPGLENNEYIDDYGAKAVTLEAHTVSSKAKVKYQIVDMNDQPITGYNATDLTNTNGVHRSEKITLFTDKPTRIKAWVIAANGSTTNDSKGLWKMTYNPVPLVWSYEDRPNGGDYITKAYDLIEIEKAKITDPAKKIYLVFIPWKEADGYTVVNDSLPAEQTAFVKLGPIGNLQEYYKTSIDVTKLIDGSATELKATLKMKKSGKDCLTYDVKIKVKA